MLPVDFVVDVVAFEVHSSLFILLTSSRRNLAALKVIENITCCIKGKIFNPFLIVITTAIIAVISKKYYHH